MASPKGGEQESLPLCLSKRKSDTGNFHSVAISALRGNSYALCFCDDRISGRKISDIDTAGTVAGGDCGTGSG